MAAAAAVKGRLAHQTVHTGLGSQPTKGIFTLKLDRSALQACNFSGRCLNHGSFKAHALAPAQVHPQQHFRPILSLGTTGSRLHVKIGIVGVHVPGEHAPKLQLFQLPHKGFDVLGDRIRGITVILGHCHLQQFMGIGAALLKVIDGLDDHLQ